MEVPVWLLFTTALAGEPCLDRECLYCLLGEPSSSAAVKAAIDRYRLAAYSDMWFNGGVALEFGADPSSRRISTVVHAPQSCSGPCPGGTPFGFTSASDKAAVEAALPGGTWTVSGGHTRWTARHDELSVTVEVDDRGRVQRIEARAAAPLDAVHAAWCRDGAWPGVLRSDGTIVEDVPDEPTRPTTEATLARVGEAWAARFREAPDGSPKRAHAWAMVEATDHLRKAARSVLTCSDHLAEAARAADNVAARPAYLNAHAELRQVVWYLDEAIRHLRAAAGLSDDRSRAEERITAVEALRADVQHAVDTLPSSDEVAASNRPIAPLLPSLIAGVLRFDDKIQAIGGGW